MPLPQPLAATSHTFETASRAVLSFLNDRLGFDLWMVTRTEGEDWIVLQMADSGYNVPSRSVFRWADSMCSRMVEGLGPRIAPAADSITAYAAAPIARKLNIGAYVGVPLTYSDGSLFGTLCAIHPTPKPVSITSELPLIELLASMLSGLLNAELNHLKASRSAELAAQDAETDAMTGLYNRRGWDRLLKAEEERCRRYGHPATVFAIDLNGLKTMNDSRGHAEGDKLICRAGDLIRAAARSSDVVARTGGDEFALLAAECDAWHAQQLRLRIKTALNKGSVSASIGHALRTPSAGLHSAWEQADHAMYSEKSGERSREPQHRSTIA